MKVSKDFIMREIAGEYMLVPVGEAAARFNGLVTMNEIGSFIFKALGEEQTAESLLALITAEYNVDEATARTDLEEFLDQLRELDALIEDR